MILQLDPAIPVYVMPHDVCPGGKGMAHLVIDHSADYNLQWVVFLDESLQCWTVENKLIRAQTNITMGRIKK